MTKLTTEQLGKLLFKSDCGEPRRNLKRFLKSVVNDANASLLDEALEAARADPAARREAKRLARDRKITAKTVETEIDGRVIEMLAAIRLRLAELNWTQAELAEVVGVPQSQIAAYLTGAKAPGIANLAKIAAALGCEWRLNPR